MSNLRLLKRNEVDEQKWNSVIDSATHSLPYAYTWYLDAVAENWDALVFDDYRAVMPLTWLRKLGVKCLYQPYYCQQAGVFAAQKLNATALQLFIDALKGYAYVNINLNPEVAPVAEKNKMTGKKNLLLGLEQPYENLQRGFSDNHRRNIGKAQKAGLVFKQQVEPAAFQQFYLQNINRERENFKPKHERLFSNLLGALLKNSAPNIYWASDTYGRPMAGVLVICHGQRRIGLINTSSETGKKTGAAHFLYSSVIQQFAGQALLFDFEGSSVPSISRFYEGFGARPEQFFNYKKVFFR